MEYIGISGWTYEPWRGVFYPEGLVQKRELEYAASQFNSIEINGTHYSLQKPESFKKWASQTPETGFLFSVKGPQYITHRRRLKEVEAPLANFFASGVLALAQEGKLGPFLWQLPPSFKFDGERIAHFLELLPEDTTAAAKLGAQHDDHLRSEAWLEAGKRQPLRHAMEVRHESFMVPEFFTLLRKHRVAFVFADTAGKWPYAEDLTSDFVYIRLHGDKELYVSGYTDKAIEHWAERIRHWREGEQPKDAKLVREEDNKPPRQITDVFVYFDNDVKTKAPRDAEALTTQLTRK